MLLSRISKKLQAAFGILELTLLLHFFMAEHCLPDDEQPLKVTIRRLPIIVRLSSVPLPRSGQNLRALEHDAETLRAQAQASKASDEALRLIQASYEAGTVSYLQVLVADNQYHQAKIGLSPGTGPAVSGHCCAFCCSGWWLVEF